MLEGIRNEKYQHDNKSHVFRSAIAGDTAEERRRLLTKVAEVPNKLLFELATDRGAEGIKSMLKADNWDETKPLATIVHLLGPAGHITGTKWMIWVRIKSLKNTIETMCFLRRGGATQW